MNDIGAWLAYKALMEKRLEGGDVHSRAKAKITMVIIITITVGFLIMAGIVSYFF